MSERLNLKASVRTATGKNANRRLRETGMIPAVFYTSDGNSSPVQVPESALMKVYNSAGRTTLIDLEVEDNGKKATYPCLIWDVEYYPTKYRFQHVDFYGVDLNKTLKVRVPIEFVGVAKGTKLGGKLETYREQMHILSKPADLPKKISVDISNLDVGQGLRVADLVLPSGVSASYTDNYAIISVVAPGGSKDSEDESEE